MTMLGCKQKKIAESRGFISSAPLCFAVVLTLLLSASGPAFADLWYEDYDKAEQALANGEWQEAISRLQSALEGKGDSSARARTYGMNFTPYFPYFKLGVAYFNLGQHDAALQAFATEESLGAIAQAPSVLDELKSYRERINDAKAAAAAQEQARIAKIVDDNLAEARRLETAGQLDEAMVAVGKALAVAPDDAQAKALLDRLGQAITRSQEERQLDQQIATITRQGRDRLAAGDYQDAAQLFERALALKASPELRRLRDEATTRLKAEADRVRDAQERATRIASGLREAGSLETRGDFAAALARLQEVLALDAGNQQALTLQTRLRRAQADADTRQARTELVQQMQADLEQLAGSDSHELILAAANRLLAVDSGNAVAMQHLTTAYRQINRRLLGSGPVENFPPAIRFADFRDGQLDDGLQIQRVASPDFRLSGTIFDEGAVDLTFQVTRYGGDDDRNDESSTVEVVDGSNSGQQLGDNYINEFTLRDSLFPGLQVFRIEATDADGVGSSSEYAVVYDRPLHRSPWSYAALGAMLLGVGGLLYGRRARRRRRLLTRRYNPFMAGAPVMNPELFFGRQQLLERVLQTVHNNSLLLFGERRIGKTSLQHQIKRRLREMQDPDYEFFPAYIDLQGTPEQKFFSTMAHDMFEELTPWLGDMEPGEARTATAGYGYRDFVADLRRVIKALQEKTDKRVKLVLLIDEVDELNAYDPRVNQRLRSLFMKSFAENLVAVVSGVGIKKHWESEGSPWYNFFEELEVKPFDRTDAEALITRPVQGLFQVDSGVVDRIVDLTDCKPYLIQKVCIAIVDRLHQQGRRRITVADVDSIGRPKEA